MKVFFFQIFFYYSSTAFPADSSNRSTDLLTDPEILNRKRRLGQGYKPAARTLGVEVVVAHVVRVEARLATVGDVLEAGWVRQFEHSASEGVKEKKNK